MAWTDAYDPHFCVAGKKYGIKKLILKSVAIIESSLRPDAYRFEPAFWDSYLKDKPEWNKYDPRLVSASYGLCQIMLPVAVELGLTEGGDMAKVAESLKDPLINITLCAKLLRKHIDKATEKRYGDKFYWLSNLQVGLARYNGGGFKNPDENGDLRNNKYVRKVMRQWGELRQVERECDNG
ncbi:MAG: lytic transglycosylase domain-containing protein [Dehalococcoidia bacterium]|jgi:soluble lytic murein transglycosylase-like protein